MEARQNARCLTARTWPEKKAHAGGRLGGGWAEMRSMAPLMTLLPRRYTCTERSKRCQLLRMWSKRICPVHARACACACACIPGTSMAHDTLTRAYVVYLRSIAFWNRKLTTAYPNHEFTKIQRARSTFLYLTRLCSTLRLRTPSGNSRGLLDPILSVKAEDQKPSWTGTQK